MKFQPEDVLKMLKSLGDPAAVAGMARFGINPENTYGVSVPALRRMAKEIGRDHVLAQRLWASGIHEARLLAGLVDDPAAVNEAQMEAWAKDFDSWDVVDGSCSNLFEKTPFAYQKAVAWAGRREEYVKRAGFVLMARLAVGTKKADDKTLETFLPYIEREADDTRNFVKKAVNWALRQIGKHSPALNRKAIATARQIAQQDSPGARWIAADALRELTSPAVQARLRAKSGGQAAN
ncbi:MAG: DNA alkylation repair protein [Dehalococcoidales bacterium]